MLETPRVSREAGENGAGFYQHSVSLVSALLSYGKARFELAGIEGKHAGAHYAIILGMAIAALVVILLGYVFFCLALVFVAAWLMGGGNSWIWATFGMAVLHFLGAGTLLFLAKNRLSEPVFAATLNEFKKDHEWLNSKSRKTS